MSTIQRDKQPKGNGKAPAFQIRITPELKAQFEEAAKAQGMSLGNWFKNLGREELKKLNICPKG
ncbi:toxin-antitoxin system HicB family antitoxin [Cronobacter turicensis]|nr:toxin-antitoxin system HicB family antitoxin [Cronobacter turicensis]